VTDDDASVESQIVTKQSRDELGRIYLEIQDREMREAWIESHAKDAVLLGEYR
jgi:hypothetical protein